MAVVADNASGLSIIIPVLNEAGQTTRLLGALQPLRQKGHELIIVDGGSSDGTPEKAKGLADRVLLSARGRARQMNAGARVARGEILLFLHADSHLPPEADRLIIQAMENDKGCWGRFDVRLTGKHWLFRVIERMMNWRSCITGIATGDQAIFVSRRLFEQLGGFSDIPLMEDIELSRRLKNVSRPHCLHTPLRTSSRRWEEKGIIRTVLLMWSLRLAYFFGISPQRLVAIYYPLHNKP